MKNPMLLLSIAICAVLIGYVAWAWTSDHLVAFLPGQTTHGHYQIELACSACHTPFEGASQDACVECHGKELEIADDSHPKSKFTDPRNADRVAKLDARECITCHVEHRPDLTHAMGVTQPDDYCYHCHSDIEEERPSHAGLPFDGCQAAGCHNFHDNRGLHEDFLEKHLEAPWLADEPALKLLASARPPARETRRVLSRADADVGAGRRVEDQIFSDWEASAHARAEVNCTDCHTDPESATGEWIERPGYARCQSCHKRPVEGFLGGHHGMRLALELPPMRPGEARLPMREDASERELGCGSCHGAHRYDRVVAATEACLGCHADEHSLAYEGSAHARLWTAEKGGVAAEGTGVSCATCHLPREKDQRGREGDFVVQHNQNDNLRPNEKMIRGVCQDCHGVPFILDALADVELIRKNFAGRPRVHVESVDMVKDKLAKNEVSRAQ